MNRDLTYLKFINEKIFVNDLDIYSEANNLLNQINTYINKSKNYGEIFDKAIQNKKGKVEEVQLFVGKIVPKYNNLYITIFPRKILNPSGLFYSESGLDYIDIYVSQSDFTPEHSLGEKWIEVFSKQTNQNIFFHEFFHYLDYNNYFDIKLKTYFFGKKFNPGRVIITKDYLEFLEEAGVSNKILNILKDYKGQIFFDPERKIDGNVLLVKQLIKNNLFSRKFFVLIKNILSILKLYSIRDYNYWNNSVEMKAYIAETLYVIEKNLNKKDFKTFEEFESEIKENYLSQNIWKMWNKKNKRRFIKALKNYYYEKNIS